MTDVKSENESTSYSIVDFRKKMGRILSQAARTREGVEIESHGKPYVWVSSLKTKEELEQYESLKKRIPNCDKLIEELVQKLPSDKIYDYRDVLNIKKNIR